MKNLNFITNRICANTPPCCSKRASRFVWVLVLMLTIGIGQMWGAVEYEELYNSGSFTTVETHSYTQNKTFTLNLKGWTASVSQVNSSVFYLGCSSTHAAKGVLNDNSTFSEIVTALRNADSYYNGSKRYETAHAYALLFENAYNDVTKVTFNWSGGNNAFQVYLFGYTGSAWVKLANKNYSTSGASVAGSVEWAGDATNFTKFAIAARPGTSTTVVTSAKSIRPEDFIIYKTKPSKILSSIAITNAPTKTNYLNGETFSKLGAVVRATYSDASTTDVSSSATWNKTTLSTSDTQVTASYTEGGVTKTDNQSINVYSVTIQVKDEDGNTLSGSGMPTASATGKNITASASGNNYVFKEWVAVTAAGTSFANSENASTTLNDTPTGNVTIKAVYHKPISVTWKVNNGNWNDKGGTATVAYNTAWSSLTLPTAPVPNEDGCGNKFMGWTTTNIGAVGLTEAEDISELVIMNSENKSGISTKITEGITFYAVFADYAE